MLVIVLLLLFIAVIIGDIKGGRKKGEKRLKLTENFMLYIKKWFNIPIEEKELLKIYNKYNTDKEFFDAIKHLCNYDPKLYLGKNYYIVKLIKDTLGSFDTVLDVGNESIEFLNELEKENKKAFGINIKSGFEHYKTFNDKDPRFQYYDGIIPFEKIDLIICNAVIHHVVELKLFLDEICRVGTYIFIKENDLVDAQTIYFYKLQHLLYEGYLIGEKECYRRYDITFSRLKKEMKQRGFKIYKEIPLDNIFKTGYLVFKKNT